MSRAAWLPVLAAHSCFAAATFTVSGVVVNSVTNEPIPRALVQSTGAEQKVVFSGQDGRFQMDGVPQGTVYIIPQKPGFVDTGKRTPVKVGSDTSLVTIKLAPESSIAGRIVDRDGEAIEGLQVECVTQRIMNGRNVWQPCGNAQSDETGNFHMQSLPPGSYVLRTGLQALFPNLNSQNDDPLPQQVYPPHFYPEAADISSVQPLVVGPGETARADFAIAPVPAFRVSGSTSPGGQNIFGFIETADGQRVANFSMNRRTGGWRSTPLPAGDWKIVLQSQRGPDSGLFGEQTVHVASSDIKNVQLALEPLPAIAVNVTSPATDNNARQVAIQLMPDKPAPSNYRTYGSSASPQNPTEAPAVRDVPPGTYSVFVLPYSAYCLGSISAGGVDLTRNSLVVSEGGQTPPIDVTLEDNCASIQGQIRMDHPIENASVILAPSSRAILPQVISIQQDGSFAFNRLSPGDYRLYAVSTADGLEYGNPEAMRQIDGVSVTLAAKQKSSVTLNLVTRDAK
ncbi:MAG TPA: carboxypeptidase-like regulatory domain-containing protein [Bryobacteraceae bacterium]